MPSSSKLLQDLADRADWRDPGFALVLPFEYYDGPEFALGLFPSGEAVRIESVGDSRSRLFRAFELTPLAGNWLAEVQRVCGPVDFTDPRRGHVPAESFDLLAQLEKRVRTAKSGDSWLAVGEPDLSRVSVVSISQSERQQLRSTGDWETSFRVAHQLMKRHRRFASKLR